ncbi:MAG: hypothetical protein H6Q13_3473 [Bacteroidetes bacterium]|nr:hypothetical protein [Bacteroidota bacterium]
MKRILPIILLITFLISQFSICLAQEKPLGKITSSKDVIEKYFKNNTALDSIEGIWTYDMSGHSFEVAIIKNTFNIYPTWDYVAIITDKNTKLGGSKGEVKILLKKTASPHAFKGSYFLEWFTGLGTDTEQVSTTFIGLDNNLYEFSLPINMNLTGLEKHHLLRIYPEAK